MIGASLVCCVMQISPRQIAVFLQPGLGCCLRQSLQPAETEICMHHLFKLTARSCAASRSKQAGRGMMGPQQGPEACMEPAALPQQHARLSWTLWPEHGIFLLN